jgi:hypothetical protein
MRGETNMNTPRDLAMEIIYDRHWVSEKDMLQACLAYMSWDDVADMLKTNEMLEPFIASYLAKHQIYETS